LGKSSGIKGIAENIVYNILIKIFFAVEVAVFPGIEVPSGRIIFKILIKILKLTIH